MERKTFEFEIKELTEEGKFSGYLATFGNVDSGGDIVDHGAFKKTLRENKRFALNWGHMPSSPDLTVGSFSAEEDEKGLFIKDGEFFLDLEGGKKAYLTVKKLFEKGIKMGLSMGYRTVKDMLEKIEGGFVRHLKEVKLLEGALTLFPMNELARVVSVKGEEEIEMKPMPNFHACVLTDKGKYTRFTQGKQKHNGKEYVIVYGWKKDGKSEAHSYRYDKEKWGASEARSHCKEHDGTFEPASEKEYTELRCSSCGDTLTLEKPGGKKPTRKDEPRIFSSVIEGLKEKPTDKPQSHLFGKTIEILKKKSNTEEKN